MCLAAQYVALFGLLVGFALSCGAVFSPYWARNDQEDTLRDDISMHKGLWIECRSLTTGNWDCDDYNRFFINLPLDLQGARGFSIGSMFLSLISLGMLIAGLECCPGSMKPKIKRKARLFGGLSGAGAGIAMLVAASWYGAALYNNYTQATQFAIQGYSVTRWVFGESLFLGWVGGAVSLVSSGLAFCSACGRSEDEYPDVYGYGGQPSKAAAINEAYV